MQISAKSKLLGVTGYPIEHSLSPLMHNAALEFLGLDYCYLPLPLRPEDLAKGIAGLKVLGFKGFNITIPHKEAIIALLDELDVSAARVGAVNTVVRQAGKFIGFNTDGGGFLRSIRELWQYEPNGQQVVLLGAGGAAKAVATALAAEGVVGMTIANRDVARAARLCEQLQKNFTCRARAVHLLDPELDQALAQSSLVVQTTPAGMFPELTAKPCIDTHRLLSHNLVYDLIFNPSETQFLAGARQQGCRTANGLGMLLHQGAMALELWTGLPAPLDVMRGALQDRLITL